MRSGLVRLVNKAPGPLVRGLHRSRAGSALLRPIMNRTLPHEPTAVVIRSGLARGLTIVIRPQDEKYYWAGTYEPAVQEALAVRLTPGDTFWDIGAHCGFFTCLASRIVAPGGQVVAFEPIDENRKRLAESVRLNNFESVVVEPFAIDASGGLVALQGREYSSMWTVADRGPSTRRVTVPSRTLDEISSLHPSSPAVIKIDVEGAEGAVFQGGLQFLRNHRPTLLVEFHSSRNLTDAQSILEFYEFKSLNGTHWLLTPR